MNLASDILYIRAHESVAYKGIYTGLQSASFSLESTKGFIQIHPIYTEGLTGASINDPSPIYAPVFQVASKRTKLPTGRILNRFSKDIDIIDTTVPMNVRQLFNQLLTVLGTVVAVVFAMPIFIVIVIPVAFLYYIIQKFYVATARQVWQEAFFYQVPNFLLFRFRYMFKCCFSIR